MKRYQCALLAVACLCSTLSLAQEIKPRQENEVVGEDSMKEAVTLAVGHVKAYLLRVRRTGTSPYRLIAAQNLIHKGDAIWLVTFKPADLVPKDPTQEAIGAGGELFVTVNLNDKQCTMTHGE